MHLAHEAARKAGHVEIMPVDLLSGLLSQNECTARRALVKVGVSADALRQELERRSPPEEGPFNPLMVFSRPASHLIDLAYDEARQMKHTHIGTEHLLLAMARDIESVPGSLIADAGVDLSAVRMAVRQLQGRGNLVRSSSAPLTPPDVLLRSAPGNAEEADPLTMVRPSLPPRYVRGMKKPPRFPWIKLLITAFRTAFL